MLHHEHERIHYIIDINSDDVIVITMSCLCYGVHNQLRDVKVTWYFNKVYEVYYTTTTFIQPLVSHRNIYVLKTESCQVAILPMNVSSIPEATIICWLKGSMKIILWSERKRKQKLK